MVDPTARWAFTLAEVLITLGVIGVVAALLMPVLITNVTERVNSNREANIALKVTKAMEKMQALGLLNATYASTDQFVDELQKHLKIAKRCDAAHIAECWPTAKVTTSDKEEFEVRKAKKGINLHLQENKTDNVGLILADGAALILTYNENSTPIEAASPIVASNKSLPVGMGKFKDFAYSTSSAAAIDFVMDVNGAKGPNSETIDGKYKDIRSFRAARFSEGCPGLYVSETKYCFVDLGTNYSPINTCNDKTWDKYGTENRYCDNNYFAGAKKACADLGMQVPYSLNTYAGNGSRVDGKWVFSKAPSLKLNGCYWVGYLEGESWADCVSGPVSSTGPEPKNTHYSAICFKTLK